MKRLKHILFWVILLAIPIVILEVGCALLITFSPELFGWKIRKAEEILDEQARRMEILLENGSRTRIELHSTLGWTYRAGFENVIHSINSAGLRSFREYSQTPDSGVIRVSVFGDSFVYCEEVPNQSCWTYLLESGAEDLEVLNYGVGGYGTDQAFLRFLFEGKNVKSDIVIIGFAPVDLRRIGNVYRRFISDREIPLFKPRFTLTTSGISILDIPLPDSTQYQRFMEDPLIVMERYGEHDEWYSSLIYDNPLYDFSSTIRFFTYFGERLWRRYLSPSRIRLRDGSFNGSSQLYELQFRIFTNFADSIRAMSAKPVILFFPDRESILRAISGKATIYHNMRAALEERGIPVLDLAVAFRSASPGRTAVSQWFAPHGHYSPAANQIIARWLEPELRRLVSDTSSIALD